MLTQAGDDFIFTCKHQGQDMGEEARSLRGSLARRLPGRLDDSYVVFPSWSALLQALTTFTIPPELLQTQKIE
jgi:hypothetical protein